jgi:RNA polymerase sigma-70 factor (ECF subfamily)
MSKDAATTAPASQTERFRSLYTRTQGRIFAFSFRRTHSFEDAGDVFSETYLVAWRKIDEVPDGEESILWLYATCRRVLANHYRKDRRRFQLLSEMGAEVDKGFLAEQGSPVSTAQSARELLWRLPERDREILMLAAWEGLDSNEIGHVLGCSAVAARVRLHRARILLSDEMRRMDLLSSNESHTHRETQREAPAIRETLGRHDDDG